MYHTLNITRLINAPRDESSMLMEMWWHRKPQGNRRWDHVKKLQIQFYWNFTSSRITFNDWDHSRGQAINKFHKTAFTTELIYCYALSLYYSCRFESNGKKYLYKGNCPIQTCHCLCNNFDNSLICVWSVYARHGIYYIKSVTITITCDMLILLLLLLLLLQVHILLLLLLIRFFLNKNNEQNER